MKTGGGLLRERLRFERRAAGDDGAGNHVAGFAPEFIEAARVKPLRGDETVLAARLTGVTAYEITIRSNSRTRQIGPEWRAVDTRDGAVYSIRAAVNPDEHDRYVVLTAETGVADG